MQKHKSQMTHKSEDKILKKFVLFDAEVRAPQMMVYGIWDFGWIWMNFGRILWTKCHSLRMQKCSLMQLMMAGAGVQPRKDKHCISQMYSSNVFLSCISLMYFFERQMSGAGVQPRKDKHQTALRRATTVQWYIRCRSCIRCTSCTHAQVACMHNAQVARMYMQKSENDF